MDKSITPIFIAEVSLRLDRNKFAHVVISYQLASS